LFFVEHQAQPEVYDNGWRSVVWAFAQYIQDPGGFADMPPITLTGQIISVIVGVLGIAIFAVPAGLIGSGFTEVMEEEQKEKEQKDNIGRIVHAFKFIKDQHYTNLLHVPRYKPINSLVSSIFLSEDTIISAIEKSECLHLFNLAEAQNKTDKPEDKLVVVNYLKNHPYGCFIDRHSKVTIVETSGIKEPITSWYAYHLAKIGGFNFVSKEVEVDPDNPVTYYNITDINDCPNLRLFIDDIDSVSSCDDSWVIFILEACGPQTGVNRRPHHVHFCYGEKGVESYDTPNVIVSDTEKFDRMYVDVEKVMSEKYGLLSDKNKYYGVQKTNIAHYIKCKNAFTLRLETKITVFDTNCLATAQSISEVFNRHIESDVTKETPPEMLKRPKGHDFGMGDYVN
jgi:voltage-gated potassium channel